MDKECSTITIKAITGFPVEDVQRTFSETIFAIQDMGYQRDLSLTRVWRGKTVRQFQEENHVPLGAVNVVGKPGQYDAHIMPVIDGQLRNVNGYWAEPIAAVMFKAIK